MANNDDIAKVNSMLDDDGADTAAENDDILGNVAKASANSKGSLATRIFNMGTNSASKAIGTVASGAANTGSRIIAGGLAAVQTASATSLVTILMMLLGISGVSGNGYSEAVLDDYIPDDDYSCLDEYSKAYKGVFGTIGESPLADQNSIVVKRLKEINEWSKTFVGQSVPDRLVCDEKSCEFYGREGCRDGDHKVKKVKDASYTWMDTGAQIDLANVRRIHDFFSAYGLTDVQIAAICGVMTIESRIDFTSVEGYNIQGDRYGLDPSQTVTVSKTETNEAGEEETKEYTYGFKPYAEGLEGSPIQTATCIHELTSSPYDGDDKPIDYGAYSSKYPSINKLGIGTIGFTDGPGFYNNTFLRNYADFLNDKVNTIQNLVEGSRGWREALRKRAADAYHIAYGAEGEDKRGTATNYVEKVDESTLLDPSITADYELWDEREGKSSGWLYKENFKDINDLLKKYIQAMEQYQQAYEEYMEILNELQNTSWHSHEVIIEEDPEGVDLQDMSEELEKLKKSGGKELVTTDFQDEYDPERYPTDQYMSIEEIEKLKKCDKSDKEEDWIEFTKEDESVESRNAYDIVYPQISIPEDPPPATEKTKKVTKICKGSKTPTGGTGLPDSQFTQTEPQMWMYQNGPSPYDIDYAAYQEALNAYYAAKNQFEADKIAVGDGNMPTAPTPPTPPDNDPTHYSSYDSYYAAWNNYHREYNRYYEAWQQYKSDFDYCKDNSEAVFGSSSHDEEECKKIDELMKKLDEAKEKLGKAKEEMEKAKEEMKEKAEAANKWAKVHAHDVVRYYNALQDYYTALSIDMEGKVRDGTFIKTFLFDDTAIFSKTGYDYEFQPLIDPDGDPVKFRDVFEDLKSGEDEEEESSGEGEEDEEKEKQEIKKLKMYYELWQNYAKYATNLPANGKYINWWTPEVQLLFMVGGSYDVEKEQGLKIRKEYREDVSCGTCGSGIPEYDTDTSKFYYDWMSTWKGENYTGRDLTTATKNFYLDIVSGGIDDGTLKTRTEYAYAYYYMFQYDSPYQQAIDYASVGGEASKIMDEMIAEGRWQTNTSNTLSDTAMPHNDKWKEYQKNLGENNEIIRQWDIDTSTTLSRSMLATLSDKQSHSKVNLLTDIWNGCRYINVIDNTTPADAALYLADNPLIYDKGSKFYKMKYGEDADIEPISDLTKTVYDVINMRLSDNGKDKMEGENIVDDTGFNYIKTCILWSGMDIEFENIHDVDELKEYLEEATSSVWQTDHNEDYQKDYDEGEFKTGRGNSKIWEQQRLGPFYDENGELYYKYRWELVPRTLSEEEENEDTKLKWYDDMREDAANNPFGNSEEDYDKYQSHKVYEHETANQPNTEPNEEGDNITYDKKGYERKLNEDNNRTADWVRVDWECWDDECEECGGKGGHGDFDLLAQGDIIISPDGQVYMWLGEKAVTNMFPLETQPSGEGEDGTDSGKEAKDFKDRLVLIGGSESTKLKSINDISFEWSKPCESYENHECKEHNAWENLPKEPKSSDDDPDSCIPYNPEGKWNVYRLITPNYTDTYRSAAIIKSRFDTSEWETWYKYKYKGMSTYADSRRYLEEVRKEIDQMYNDIEFGRDKRQG